MPTTRRSLPSSIADSQNQDFRCSRYGDLTVIPMLDGVMGPADEGTYFTGVNPTSGTGIAFAVTTAFSDTVGGFIALQNNDALGGKRMYLDYIKLIVTVAPASGTSAHADLKVDNVLARYTSGGTAITPANPNMDSSNASIAKLAVGALTLAASSSSARTIGRIQLRTAIPVVGDTYIFTFGGVDKPSGGGVINGTNPQIITYAVPPVILGPQHTFSLHMNFPSNATTPASFEVEAGWIER